MLRNALLICCLAVLLVPVQLTFAAQDPQTGQPMRQQTEPQQQTQPGQQDRMNQQERMNQQDRTNQDVNRTQQGDWQTRDEGGLPDTAGELPVLAVIGLVSLLCAAGFRLATRPTR